jgi:hypothetical protein
MWDTMKGITRCIFRGTDNHSRLSVGPVRFRFRVRVRVKIRVNVRVGVRVRVRVKHMRDNIGHNQV